MTDACVHIAQSVLGNRAYGIAWRSAFAGVGTGRARLPRMTSTNRTTDRAAEKALKSYCDAYVINRPFSAPAVPSLVVATLSGTGREVYNRDGGSTIAVFSSTEAARKAVHKITGVWP